MNYLWACMILIGVSYAAFHGTLPALTSAALSSAQDAVTLCITMTGVMSFWVGLMKIAEKSGMIAGLSRRMSPFLRFLFPRLPKDHAANEYIATNMIANIFGLGWAATPAGLKGMQALEALEEERRKGGVSSSGLKWPLQSHPRGRQYLSGSAKGDGQRRNVHLPHHQYLLPAADPGKYHRLPEPVRKREPGCDRGTGDPGDGGEHADGDCVL